MTASRGDGPRVLIIVENLPAPLDRRVWMEALSLTEAGYQVTVLCPRGKGYEDDEEVVEGVRILRYPLPPERSSVLGYLREYAAALVGQTRLAWRVHRGGRVDVVHACNPPDLIFLVALPFKILFSTRFVFDQHDLSPELYVAKFGRRGWGYHALRWAEALTYRTADVVIVPNESYREVAMKRGHVSQEHVYVVRSAPELSKFRPTAPNPDYRRGRRYLVGYVGVMGESDGLDHLLRAAEDIVIRRGREDVAFCLIGTGPAWSRLQQQARDAGIDTFVEFTGRISDTELRERLSSCDVCVDPDPWNEFNDKSTMNKVMEYMALGRPIVQYDLTEGRRSAGDASAYAKRNDPRDLASKILDLLGDPATRTRMAEAGERRMRDALEWRHQVPHLLRAYERLTSDGSTKGVTEQGETL